MKKKIICVLGLFIAILGIYSIKPTKANSDLIYDVVLFWGQSNMVGYAGAYAPEKESDTRYDYKDNNSVKEFSSKTKINPIFLKNSIQMNYTVAEQTPGTAFEYLYSGNTLREINSSTTMLGEKLRYDAETKTLVSNADPASMERSAGTNMIPQFCKQYYERTGHGVIAVFAANGGEKIENFLPADNPNYADATQDKRLYESMVLKYNQAIQYLTDNNYQIGEKLYVVFQGESNCNITNQATDEQTENLKNTYKQNYKTIHEHLKGDTGITKGAIVFTSGIPGQSTPYKAINTINAAQQELINENDDIILGSSFAFDNYIPNKDIYDENSYINSKYVDENGNKLDWNTALEYARGSVCYNENSSYNNAIHFTSAALAQIGNDVANSFSSKDDYYYDNTEFKTSMPSCPDPFIFYNEDDGYYYLFHTNILGYVYSNNSLVYYKSKDLKNWERASTTVAPIEEDGIYVKDSNGNEIINADGDKITKRVNFWAPEVFRYNNKIYIFYSSFQITNEEEVINSVVDGVATIEPVRKAYISVLVGDTFNSTFTEETTRLFEFENSVIDANVLFDDNGKIYLYFVEDQVDRGTERSSWIYGVELNDKLNGIIGEPVFLLKATLDWEKNISWTNTRSWTEGPCVIKNDGKYYMMYSANYYQGNTYSVGYATSTSPLGQYDKNDNGNVTSTENLLLTTDGKTVFGPGHNNVFKTADGSLYTVYHELNKDKASDSYTSRNLAFDKIIFKDDKIYINGPTTGIQPIPSGVNGYQFVNASDINIIQGGDYSYLKDGINSYSRNNNENYIITNKLQDNEYDLEYTFDTPQDIKYIWIYPNNSATNDDLPISANVLINNSISLKDINLNLLENSKNPAVIDLSSINLPEGSTNIKIAFKGSKTASLSEITFQKKQDTTPPTVPKMIAKLENAMGDDYKSGSWTNKNIFVALLSSDMSGIARYEWKEGENGEWQTTHLTTKDGMGTITFGVDRNETIYFRAIDTAGNISETSSFIMRKDKVAPVLSGIENSSNGNWVTSISLSWDIIEEGSGIDKVEFSYDGSNFTKLGESEWYGLTRNNERDDILYIRVTDKAGNNSNIESTNMKIDKTAPKLSNIQVSEPVTGTYKAGETITIVATYSENIYGDENLDVINSSTAPVLRIRFGDGKEKIATFNSAKENMITYTYTIESGDNGKLEVSSYVGDVYDKAGNSLEVENKNIEGNQIIADTKQNQDTDGDSSDTNNGEILKQEEEKGDNYSQFNKENISYQNENLANKLLPKTGAIGIGIIVLILNAIIVGVFYYKYKKV